MFLHIIYNDGTFKVVEVLQFISTPSSIIYSRQDNLMVEYILLSETITTFGANIMHSKADVFELISRERV